MVFWVIYVYNILASFYARYYSAEIGLMCVLYHYVQQPSYKQGVVVIVW
jgi:hypothetical protein